MTTVRISIADGKPCSGHLLCGHGSMDDEEDDEASCCSRDEESATDCDCQQCPVCGMRVGRLAVDLCKGLHKQFGNNNQRLSSIDGLPCCFNGCCEVLCECQNCNICGERNAGWRLDLTNDHTKHGQWVGPHCGSCDMGMFLNDL